MDGISTNYQAGLGSLFASVARNVEYNFVNRVDCQLGAYSLRRGDLLRVLSDGDGLFSVYVE